MKKNGKNRWFKFWPLQASCKHSWALQHCIPSSTPKQHKSRCFFHFLRPFLDPSKSNTQMATPHTKRKIKIKETDQRQNSEPPLFLLVDKFIIFHFAWRKAYVFYVIMPFFIKVKKRETRSIKVGHETLAVSERGDLNSTTPSLHAKAKEGSRNRCIYMPGLFLKTIN